MTGAYPTRCWIICRTPTLKASAGMPGCATRTLSSGRTVSIAITVLSSSFPDERYCDYRARRACPRLPWKEGENVAQEFFRFSLYAWPAASPVRGIPAWRLLDTFPPSGHAHLRSRELEGNSTGAGRQPRPLVADNLRVARFRLRQTRRRRRSACSARPLAAIIL